MICFRCGSEVADGAPQCGNCGQRFSGTRRTFTTTTTSFRALEKRRLRAQKTAEKLGYGIGDVIAQRYEVRDLIGVGPLGAVYRVLDQEIDVDVALKVIHPGLLPDEAARENFSQTIRKVRKLSQQNIVRLYDDDADGDRAFFTMQLLEGLTLRKVIGLRQDKGQRFTVKEIEPIMVQIAMALGHAHRHTVHGDLKPENVLILPDVLKLTDFAACEAIPAAAFVKAQKEAEIGSYLAPELASGGAFDLRADIFSLGAIFYELLTGQVYGPDSPPPSQVLLQAEEAGPEGIDGFVAQATAINPRDRFENAEAFIENLATYIDGRELRSVDIRAPRSLLPEDVTRRVQAPAGLQDDDDDDGVRIDSAHSEADAERSMVEELEDDDLEIERSVDRSVERSGERSAEKSGEISIERASEGSVDKPAKPVVLISFGEEAVEAPTRPWESVGKTTTADTAPGAPKPPRTRTELTAIPAPTPWFVRSNVGFVAAVVFIVLAVGAGAWFVLRNAQKDHPVAAHPVEIKIAPDAGKPAPRPSMVVEARPEVPATQAPAPESVAVAAVAPVTEAPRPVPAATQAPAPATKAAPASKAAEPPAPATKAAPPPAPATKAAAPATQAPPPPPAPATKAVVAKAPVEEPPPPPKPVASAAGKVACPAGTILITTAQFPKGAIKGREISGADALELVKAGKAYCVDAYEYPGSGRPPKSSVTFDAASGLCKAAGKRLCADSEWARACRGAGDFPYGKAFDGTKCNTEDADGEARSVTESGKFSKCRSAVGAYDMSGNVAEWTSDQTVRGGDYTSGDDDAACSAGGKRSAGSARPTIGFRCCADPQ